MTDLEHAEAIRAAARALNNAISSAVDIGLTVEVDVVDLKSVRSPNPMPVIEAKVARKA